MIHGQTMYAVAAILAAVLVLMAVRWRAWAAASEMWRLLAVALGALTLSTILNALAGIREDRPLGPYVAGNLTAGLIALRALTLHWTPRRRRGGASSTHREADASHNTTSEE